MNPIKYHIKKDIPFNSVCHWTDSPISWNKLALQKTIEFYQFSGKIK